jgi:hypothetical protein
MRPPLVVTLLAASAALAPRALGAQAPASPSLPAEAAIWSGPTPVCRLDRCGPNEIRVCLLRFCAPDSTREGALRGRTVVPDSVWRVVPIGRVVPLGRAPVDSLGLRAPGPRPRR